MAANGSSWLLQAYLLLMLFQPLSPSSRLESATRTSDLLLEDVEEQDVDTVPVPLWATVLVFLGGLVLELLVTAIVFRLCLGRRFWKRWGEKCQSQSPPVTAEPRGCQGHNCPKKLLQLLRHNRELLLLCLQYSSPKRPRQKRPAERGIWKRRRVRFSPHL